MGENFGVLMEWFYILLKTTNWINYHGTTSTSHAVRVERGIDDLKGRNYYKIDR